MKLRALAILLLVFATKVEGRNSIEPPILQGEWALMETVNENRVDPGNDSIRMVIQGDKVVLKFANLMTNQGILKIGRREGINTIDMDLANGKVVLGLFDVKGDTLVICADDAVKGRPRSMTPKGTQWVEKWKWLPR